MEEEQEGYAHGLSDMTTPHHRPSLWRMSSAQSRPRSQRNRTTSYEPLARKPDAYRMAYSPHVSGVYLQQHTGTGSGHMHMEESPEEGSMEGAFFPSPSFGASGVARSTSDRSSLAEELEPAKPGDSTAAPLPGLSHMFFAGGNGEISPVHDRNGTQGWSHAQSGAAHTSGAAHVHRGYEVELSPFEWSVPRSVSPLSANKYSPTSSGRAVSSRCRNAGHRRVRSTRGHTPSNTPVSVREAASSKLVQSH